MNKVYLMMDEKKDYALFKVGFASNLSQRFYSYTTHNPLVECISYIETMEKSKRKIEKDFHSEIEKMGLTFIKATMDGKKTEWFKIEYNNPLYKELKSKGLSTFKCGKGRKCYTLVD